MLDLKAVARSGKFLTFAALMVALGLGILIGSFVSDGVSGAQESVSARVDQLRIGSHGDSVDVDPSFSLRDGFSSVARTVQPAVVNINTQTVIRRPEEQRRPRGDQESLRDFFGPEFWDRFFGPEQQRERKATSLGSGVLVDGQGFIMTNYHVIAPVRPQESRRPADRIDVRLSSGESFEAHVVGEDPESDLAVLKIDAGRPLPFAKIGDSTRLQVGDWVMAVGSPFDLEQTVTVGIVSATRRVVEDMGYFSDYIQTDASINPGNSGGPLVNMRGEVVGINAFISTSTGRSAGVGFAIPSSVFVNSYNQLVSKGRIERGWLGVSMNTLTPTLTPEMAEFFGVASEDPDGVRRGQGVLITQLIDESGLPAETGPAFRAGLRPEDVVVRFGDRAIRTPFDLRSAVANTPPGESVPVVVVRKGQIKSFGVTLAERLLERRDRPESLSFDNRKQERPKEIGLTFQTLSTRDSERLGLKDVQGVLIQKVAVASIADEAQLAANQVITHINGRQVRSSQELYDDIEAMSSGQGVILRVAIPETRGTGYSIGYTSFQKP